MKNLIILGIVAIFAISLNSCQDGDMPISWDDQEQMMMESGLDGIYIYDVEEVLDYNMEYLGSNAQASPRFGEDDRNGNDKGKKGKRDWKKGRKYGNDKGFLGRVFREMEMTKDQIDEIKVYFEEYKDCVALFYDDLKAVREEIYAKYADQLAELRENIQNDPDNRQEYIDQLRAIHSLIRDEMHETFDWTQRCVCLEELYAKIDNMELTEEQRAIWDEWYNNLEHPCFLDDSSEGSD